MDTNINKYIEEKVESEINKVINVINYDKKKYNNKMIYEYSINELYENTINTIINMIHDISDFLSINHTNISSEEYRNNIFKIFFSTERKLYTGIILIILSFILYFIDGVSS